MNIKQYTKLVKDFFESHAQINTTKTGNAYTFKADANIMYPAAHVEFITQNINGTNKEFQFIITIGDLVDPNLESSEEDVYSDCCEIAEDTVDYFSNQINDVYAIRENAGFKKFVNGNKDKTCGCSFYLIFDEFRVADACKIPLVNNAFESEFAPQFSSDQI